MAASDAARVGEEEMAEMIWNRKVPVLIVACPGPLREGLCALMSAMPQVDEVEEVDDIASVLAGQEAHGDSPLVLLDSNLASDGISTMVQHIKTKWPQARCIVLVDDVRQHHEAEVAGADAALLKGFSPAQLVAAIVALLPSQP